MTLTVTASGDVADYNITAVGDSVATAAGVDRSLVDVALSGGSVVIQVTIRTDSLATASSTAATLASSFTSTAAAQTFLGVVVESVDSQPTVTTVVFLNAAPPPSPPAGLALGATIGIAVGVALGLVVVLVVVAVVCMRPRRSKGVNPIEPAT